MNVDERKKKIADFKRKVRAFYKQNGRRYLPWRNVRTDRLGDHDPYKIMVSEVMLQQTQVDRVIPKYNVFIKKFPTLTSLAEAPLSDVLIVWQGLGYNRRAKMLHEAARAVVTSHKGHMPKDRTALETLHGIGPYTAGAIMIFAYNEPVVCIETNIRTVFLHEFFPNTKKVSDAALLPLIEESLDRKNPREWYAALMDYGSWLKQKHGNSSRRSAAYTKQSCFQGSNRQIRGAIIRLLADTPHCENTLCAKIEATRNRIVEQIHTLKGEGFIVCTKGKWTLSKS